MITPKRITTQTLALLFMALGLLCNAQANAEDQCGGVLMQPRGEPDSKHLKEFSQQLGYYAARGTLLKNGESTCKSIAIECYKGTACRYTIAEILPYEGHATLAVSKIYEYQITEWNNHIISAEDHHLDYSRYLRIAFNDEGFDNVQLIDVIKSPVKPDESTTEVMTVGDDPARAKLKGQTQH
jgi:hypothetical protein